MVDGTLRNNKWNDNGQEKSRLEINATDVTFLSWNNDNGNNDNNGYYEGNSDEVPF